MTFRLLSSCVAALLLAPVASSAGDTVKLNGPMPVAEAGDIESFLVTSDGARIVYRADQDANDVLELYSAPANGSAPPIRLHQALPPSKDVFLVYFLGAGDRVVFATNTAIQYRRLFSVPADGSAAPTLLSGPDVVVFALGAGGTRVVFTVDDGRLFSVPIDGSSPPIELAPGRALYGDPDFWVDGAGSQVVFVDRGQMLCSVPIDGSAAPRELFTPIHGGACSVTFASDGVHAYYVESHDIYPAYGDLYWIALDGSQAPIRLTPDGDLETLEFDENAALGRVVYRAGNSFETLFYGIDRDGTDLVQLAPLTLHVTKLHLADDGTTVVFSGDQPSALRRVRIDGSQPAVTLVPGNGQTIRRWELAGSQVVFVRTIPVDGGSFSGLYSVPIADGVAQLLNGPQAPNQGVFIGQYGDVVLAVSPDEEQVVFASSGVWGTTLQAVPVDGSEAPREIAPPGTFVEVGFAENGARVVFRGSEGTWDVTALSTPLDGKGVPVRCNGVLAPGEAFAACLDGSTPPRRVSADLIEQGDILLDFLPLADRVVFRVSSVGYGDDRVFAVDRDGTDLVQLDPPELDLWHELRLAADGTTAVFQSNLPSALYRVPIDASQAAVAIVPADGQPIAQWELVGSNLVFVRATPVDGGSFSGLYSIPIAGGVEPLLLNGPPVAGQGVVGDFVFSPDGEEVVFYSSGASGTALHAVPLDGSAPRELVPPPTSGPGSPARAKWPDRRACTR